MKASILLFSLLLVSSDLMMPQDTLFVPVGPEGYTTELKWIIDRDTADGERIHDVYKLQRGGYYFFDGIVWHDYPLIIVGEKEPAEVRPATLIQLTDAGTTPDWIFDTEGDLTLKDLYIAGINDMEIHQNFCRIIGDSVRISIEDCVFNYAFDWKGLFFFIQSSGWDFIFRNNIAINLQREDGFSYVGLMYGNASSVGDTLLLENNTIMGCAGELYWLAGTPNHVIINHNTFVSVGQISTLMQKFKYAEFTNNIYHNVQIHGDPINPDKGYTRTSFGGDEDQPLANFMLDTLGRGLTQFQLDSTLNTVGIPYQTVKIRNNNYYLNPEIVDYLDGLDDSIAQVPKIASPRLLEMASNDAEFPGIFYDTLTNTSSIDPGFTKDPTVIDSLLNWAKYQLEGERSSNFLYEPGTDKFDFVWPLIGEHFDFTYSNPNLIGSDAPHIGDLYHWYPHEYNWWLTTDIERNQNDKNIPVKFMLYQNYPNPFNPTTKIKYTIRKAVNVRLSVYNLLGEKVSKLVDKTQIAGNYEVDFDASNLSSGIYFYRLETADFIETKKMILLR